MAPKCRLSRQSADEVVELALLRGPVLLPARDDLLDPKPAAPVTLTRLVDPLVRLLAVTDTTT